MTMKTPLGRVRGLGSAKDGTSHFWHHRLTAIANLFLITFFIILIMSLHDASFEEVRAALGNPLVALVMAFTVVSVTIHMRLGMEIVLGDYYHGPAHVLLQIANTFFTIAIAGAGLFAIAKMSFGV